MEYLNKVDFKELLTNQTKALGAFEVSKIMAEVFYEQSERMSYNPDAIIHTDSSIMSDAVLQMRDSHPLRILSDS